jgi:Mg2+/Co2+ transporter CorC
MVAGRREKDHRSLFVRLVEFISPGPDTTDELIETLAEAEHRELIEPESRVMLEGVIRMAGMTVADVMVPCKPHGHARHRARLTTNCCLAQINEGAFTVSGVRGAVATTSSAF